jgi:hypothetical protein
MPAVPFEYEGELLPDELRAVTPRHLDGYNPTALWRSLLAPVSARTKS